MLVSIDVPQEGVGACRLYARQVRGMGGDVGVTLRCAVYRAGSGLVHELCSDAAVSAALCVQRCECTYCKGVRGVLG